MLNNDKLIIKLITYLCCICDFNSLEVYSNLDKDISLKYHDFIELICEFGLKFRKVIPNER